MLLEINRRTYSIPLRDIEWFEEGDQCIVICYHSGKSTTVKLESAAALKDALSKLKTALLANG